MNQRHFQNVLTASFFELSAPWMSGTRHITQAILWCSFPRRLRSFTTTSFWRRPALLPTPCKTNAVKNVVVQLVPLFWCIESDRLFSRHCLFSSWNVAFVLAFS